jgi:hypothetical protein
MAGAARRKRLKLLRDRTRPRADIVPEPGDPNTPPGGKLQARKLQDRWTPD